MTGSGGVHFHIAQLGGALVAARMRVSRPRGHVASGDAVTRFSRQTASTPPALTGFVSLVKLFTSKEQKMQTQSDSNVRDNLPSINQLEGKLTSHTLHFLKKHVIN